MVSVFGSQYGDEQGGGFWGKARGVSRMYLEQNNLKMGRFCSLFCPEFARD